MSLHNNPFVCGVDINFEMPFSLMMRPLFIPWLQPEMLEVGTLFFASWKLIPFLACLSRKKVWDLQNISSYVNEGRVALGLWNFRPQWFKTTDHWLILQTICLNFLHICASWVLCSCLEELFLTNWRNLCCKHHKVIKNIFLDRLEWSSRECLEQARWSRFLIVFFWGYPQRLHRQADERLYCAMAPSPPHQGQYSQRGGDVGGAVVAVLALPPSHHHEPGCRGTEDTHCVGGAWPHAQEQV